MGPAFAIVLLLGAVLVVHLVGIYARRLFDDDIEESESPSRTAPPRSDVRSKSTETVPAQSTDPAQSPDSGQAADPATVTCPSCGTENDRGYTFCRYCVAHLASVDER